MQTLSDDLLEGAMAMAAFIFGEANSENRRKVYRLIDAEEIPVVRKGAKIFARKSEIERAFQAQA